MGGGGIQFASLISASSRRFATIVENFARVSGVILFMDTNARAACSIAGLRYFCVVLTRRRRLWWWLVVGGSVSGGVIISGEKFIQNKLQKTMKADGTCPWNNEQ